MTSQTIAYATWAFFLSVATVTAFVFGSNSYVLLKHLSISRKLNKIRQAVHILYMESSSIGGNHRQKVKDSLLQNEKDMDKSLQRNTLVILNCSVRSILSLLACTAAIIFLRNF